MRFMMIINGNAESELGVLPSEEVFNEMNRFNEELENAGVLLGLEGLHPTSKGARIRTTNGKRVVTDGPFTESKEVLAGFWMIKVNSKEEAIQWALRCPADTDLRQIFELDDFPSVPDAVRELDARVRERVGSN